MFVVIGVVKVLEMCSVLVREKNELQSRLEENDEELDELMKKYKAAIQQVDSLSVYYTVFRKKILTHMFFHISMTDV